MSKSRDEYREAFDKDYPSLSQKADIYINELEQQKAELLKDVSGAYDRLRYGELQETSIHDTCRLLFSILNKYKDGE